MIVKGNLAKMKSTLTNNVEYGLPVGGEIINLNKHIGKTIQLNFLNQINCVSCGKITNKSFAQGFCYNCFTSAPEASECVLHPDKCQAHLGISRNMEWSKNHCLHPHIVYLAVSSNLKVGITRKTQIPTRWIDQGASSAIIIAETPNRHIAGIIEKFLMQHYSDKTSWQKMLKGISTKVDLASEKERAMNYLPTELKQYGILESKIYNIDFPVDKFPLKVTSVGFDKTKRVEGILTGIKGQYLIFDNEKVINIRKHTGYLIEAQL